MSHPAFALMCEAQELFLACQEAQGQEQYLLYPVCSDGIASLGSQAQQPQQLHGIPSHQAGLQQSFLLQLLPSLGPQHLQRHGEAVLPGRGGGAAVIPLKGSHATLVENH